MDGLFLTDDGIIEADSDTYKPLELDDEWRVSPDTEHFSLQLSSPDLSFTAQNCLEKVEVPSGHTKEIEIKQEIKEHAWFSVIDQPWKETMANSLEQRHLNEQVVPDQISVMEFTDQKTDPLRIGSREITNHQLPEESSGRKLYPEPIDLSTNLVNNSLSNLVKSENQDSETFVLGHKEQVNSNKQNDFHSEPVVDMFTVNSLSDNKRLEHTVENTPLNEIFPPRKVVKVDGGRLNSCQQTLDHEYEPVHTRDKLQDGGHCLLPCSSNKSSGVDEIKSELQKQPENWVNEDHTEDPHAKDLMKIRRKVLKLLTPTVIPKCTMVKYVFDNSQKLPPFEGIVRAFTSERTEASDAKEDVKLPQVLKGEEKEDKTEEELYILISDSDSEEDDIHIVKTPFNDVGTITNKTIDSNATHFVNSSKPEMTRHQFGSDMSDTKTDTKIVQSMETSPNPLTLDDDLENFLVSNIVLGADQNGSNSQLPDLSDNLGCILRTENIHEENSLDSVYRNMFPRNVVGLQGDNISWNRIQRSDKAMKIHQTSDNYGNLFNSALLLSGERSWDDLHNRENINAVHGNPWARNFVMNEVNYLNQIDERHFPSDRILRTTGPYVNMTVPKNRMAYLSTNIAQPDFDSFKFGDTAARVEVVDSSLNYEF